MLYKISPSKLEGNLNVVSDKSFSHRAIICASLVDGDVCVKNVNLCDDVKNTINVLRESVDIEIKNNDVIVRGKINEIKNTKFFINESASTLRFLLPILSYLSKEEIEIVVSDDLLKRGIDEYQNLFNESVKNKIVLTENSYKISGFPDREIYDVSSNVSSQYITGLLFLTTKLNHNTTIHIKDELNSIGYIDLTIDILNQFGFNVKRENNNIFVIHNQTNKINEITVPGDASFAAYINMLNFTGSNISITNKNISNVSPDYKIFSNNIKDIINHDTVDISNNPDSFMNLALLATLTEKSVKFINVDRLNKKESNRLDFIADTITNMGGVVETKNNEIIVYNSKLKETTINTSNDHRKVFFALLASNIINKNIYINDVKCVSKSCPTFFEDMIKLGMKIEKINDIEQTKLNNTKIFVGENYLSSSFFEAKTNYVVVTDRNVYSIYKNKIKDVFNNSLVYITKNVGENIKTLKETEDFIGFLLENNIQKNDKLIAFGGGTITDFVGFSASIYKRGVEFISIPTSLIAQVDASVGGKTAINFGETKNSIGSFYNPSEIYVDTAFLKTLDKKQTKDGLVEIIKIAALKNSNLFYDILDSTNEKKLNQWVLEAIKLKIEFVEKDMYDKKERQALNFGHTAGHSIELKHNFSHGESVALGMMIESNNKEIEKILTKYGYNKPDKDFINETKQNINNDKKINSNKIKLVNLKNIGDYELVEYDIDKIQW